MESTTKALLALVLSLLSVTVNAAKLALIIDDVGYRRTDVGVLNLPVPVTLSVLPHTPWGNELAIEGWRRGHEIMLHLPMVAEAGNKLGPSAITASMDEWQIALTIKRALADIPFVTGLNNHMGSQLTQQRQVMDRVMTEVSKQKLYFIDSLTTPESTAFEAAQNAGIPSLKRHVFLDNQLDEAYLQQQLQQAIDISKRYGKAILIGHPYPETLAFLETALPKLKQQDIQLVTPSSLLSKLQRAQLKTVAPATAYLHKLTPTL